MTNVTSLRNILYFIGIALTALCSIATSGYVAGAKVQETKSIIAQNSATLCEHNTLLKQNFEQHQQILEKLAVIGTDVKWIKKSMNGKDSASVSDDEYDVVGTENYGIGTKIPKK